jgi:hypothetical protein
MSIPIEHLFVPPDATHFFRSCRSRFVLALVGVYAFVARRFTAAWGLVAATLLGLSPLTIHAIEARPHGLSSSLAVAAA